MHVIRQLFPNTFEVQGSHPQKRAYFISKDIEAFYAITAFSDFFYNISI